MRSRNVALRALPEGRVVKSKMYMLTDWILTRSQALVRSRNVALRALPEERVK